jgi:diphthine synthase
MVERYAPKAKQVVQQMRDVVRQDGGSKGMFEVLDNAEYYIADAERFLRQAKFELAVLSIGYAEGLVDALRSQNTLRHEQSLLLKERPLREKMHSGLILPR